MNSRCKSRILWTTLAAAPTVGALCLCAATALAQTEAVAETPPKVDKAPAGAQPSEKATPSGAQPSKKATPSGAQPSKKATPSGAQPSKKAPPSGAQGASAEQQPGPGQAQPPAATPPPQEQTSASTTPASGPSQSPDAKSVSSPPAASEPRFFSDEPQQYRFLERVKEPDPKGPPPVIPERPSRPRSPAGAPVALALAIQHGWNKDAGYDLFSDDDVASRVDIWFSHDIWSLHPRAILAAEVGLGSGMESSEELLGSIESTLRTNVVYAGAYLRYVVESWLQPYARVAAGAAVVGVEFYVRDPGSEADDEHFEDQGLSPVGSLALGLMVRTPSRAFENSKGEFASLSLGLMVEGGYAATSAMSFALKPADDDSRDDNGNEVESRSAELGELSRSGGYVRTSLVVRF